jgi:hypothetical protein
MYDMNYSKKVNEVKLYKSIRIQSYTKNCKHFNLNFVLDSVLFEAIPSFIFNSEVILRFSPLKNCIYMKNEIISPLRYWSNQLLRELVNLLQIKWWFVSHKNIRIVRFK